MDRGVSGSGTGFDGPSAGRLGSHAFIPSHNPTAAAARDVMLKVGQGYMGRGRGGTWGRGVGGACRGVR